MPASSTTLPQRTISDCRNCCSSSMRAVADRVHAEIRHARADIVHGDDRIQLGVELGEDRLRRLRRRDHALPCRGVEARHAGVGKRRHVGQRREALFGRHRERAQFSGLDQRQRRTEIAEHQLDVAAHQIVERRRRAAIGHMGHLDAGHAGEQRRGQMMERADAAGAVAQRPFLGELDEILDAVHRQ